MVILLCNVIMHKNRRKLAVGILRKYQRILEVKASEAGYDILGESRIEISWFTLF